MDRATCLGRQVKSYPQPGNYDHVRASRGNDKSQRPDEILTMMDKAACGIGQVKSFPWPREMPDLTRDARSGQR